LTGETVYLRPVRRADLPLIRKWLCDPLIRRLIGEVAPPSARDTEKWFRKIQRDRSRKWFIIALKEGGRAIGEAGLLRIFKPWRAADASIIIGEKDCWSKGHGAETMRLLLNLAFDEMKLHRVGIGVFEFNERARRFYRRSGFKKEGVLRDGYFCDGRFYDVIMMSIVEDEYRKRRNSHPNT
jgi:RimJ/RimL family protein N-acetyltransferase